ncbi:lytic transglycosylase domain-containing protein [Paraburkholderia caribensis]|uniref:lytic transglycosylase domain-containing protein n=1 Tax=Paraburkholderia caribensis TaxID=75105 RepID=UPI00286184BD|nr:lytic transglycosylase domain-containing protein [Paraburkholderia caribensis]MDR6386010.1 soluble lytic murein transglycosylase-like protein [Paraburkholderia caribensis]
MRGLICLVAVVCIASDAHGAGRAEMMIGGLKGVDPDAGVAAVSDQPVIVEFGVPSEARHARSKVLAWTALVDDVAKRSGVDRALLMAVIDVESGGDPFAVSSKGARGLMQLMPQTGAQQGAGDLFDPYQNVVAGTRLLDTLLATFGDVPLALAAYNAGEGAVRKFGGTVPPYAETQKYVRRVMERAVVYRR